MNKKLKFSLIGLTATAVVSTAVVVPVVLFTKSKGASHTDTDPYAFKLSKTIVPEEMFPAVKQNEIEFNQIRERTSKFTSERLESPVVNSFWVFENDFFHVELPTKYIGPIFKSKEEAKSMIEKALYGVNLTSHWRTISSDSTTGRMNIVFVDNTSDGFNGGEHFFTETNDTQISMQLFNDGSYSLAQLQDFINLLVSHEIGHMSADWIITSLSQKHFLRTGSQNDWWSNILTLIHSNINMANFDTNLPNKSGYDGLANYLKSKQGEEIITRLQSAYTTIYNSDEIYYYELNWVLGTAIFSNNPIRTFEIMKIWFHEVMGVNNVHGLSFDTFDQHHQKSPRIRFESVGLDDTSKIDKVVIYSNGKQIDELKVNHERVALGFNRDPFTDFEYKYVTDSAYATKDITTTPSGNITFDLIDFNGNKLDNSRNQFSLATEN